MYMPKQNNVPLSSSDEEARMQQSMKLQEEIIPELMAKFDAENLHPLTTVEILGSTIVNILASIQDLNPDYQMEQAASGFFDQLKEKTVKLMPQIRTAHHEKK